MRHGKVGRTEPSNRVPSGVVVCIKKFAGTVIFVYTYARSILKGCMSRKDFGRKNRITHAHCSMFARA